MKIKLLYDSLFFDVTRCHDEIITVDKTTVGNLIKLLSQRYGPAFRNIIVDTHTDSPKPQVTILVNGHHQAWDVPIIESAEIAFLVPIAGGSCCLPRSIGEFMEKHVFHTLTY